MLAQVLGAAQRRGRGSTQCVARVAAHRASRARVAARGAPRAWQHTERRARGSKGRGRGSTGGAAARGVAARGARPCRGRCAHGA
eukprot:2635271-Prymnesium_polylepis.1